MLLVGLFCAGVTWMLAARYFAGPIADSQYFAEDARVELWPFEDKYGPRRYSRGVEEWLIRDYFQDRRDGVFLDVGAAHFMDESNTYYLEKELAWSGVAVDALAEFAADYQAHRPRTKFVAMFATDIPNETVRFFVSDNKLVSSANPEFTAFESKESAQPRQVPTTTLDSVLQQAGVSRLDFMSMDIELSEPKALAGFAIATYRPQLVCIEARREVRQQILDYFAQHRYVVVGKYLRADPKNLYFQPATEAPTMR